MTERTVICPYCQNPAKLVDSATIYRGRDYGKLWRCDPCDAHVGVHRNSPDYAPLGRLANKELRQWKMRAHAAFDPLWKTGRHGSPSRGMRRAEAYRWMREALGMTQEEAHVGKFDVPECKRLIQACFDRKTGHDSPTKEQHHGA